MFCFESFNIRAIGTTNLMRSVAVLSHCTLKLPVLSSKLHSSAEESSGRDKYCLQSKRR